MSDLVEFLRARLGEDEAAFTLPEWQPDVGGDWTLSGDGFFATYWPDNTVSASIYRGDDQVATSGIVSRRSRAECQAFAEGWIREHTRVLADIEAKRQIVQTYIATLAHEQQFQGQGTASAVADGARAVAEGVVRLLALPYADHPEYRPEWAP
ncbi:DUF6221 family protein [Cellulomonas shaoxiangyii]|uniref:Uncharacterized protein n=1 Tax=Cellulomonas shaoxiangyii TaxID=2566013 RepID=A0A4V1CMK7_9CELL|nr:DUF6221 family protein [Cellulomonas shaoxiangyii]QCB93285.1 hypothetical protein E5225_06710 [Cellulomonas shaoxiangyii]TGY82495.1 hypothetical protein E5226_13240 [Cellulomonas shaoxiangyii]